VQGICVTLISHALDVLVPENAKLKVAVSAELKPTSTYMCCPVFWPQIVGMTLAPVLRAETVKVSVAHFPPSTSVVPVGPTMVKLSKSNRRKQTSSAHFLTVNEQEDTAEYAVGNPGFWKYEQLCSSWEPQVDFVKRQQTPNPEAHDPEA